MLVIDSINVRHTIIIKYLVTYYNLFNNGLIIVISDCCHST